MHAVNWIAKTHFRRGNRPASKHIEKGVVVGRKKWLLSQAIQDSFSQRLTSDSCECVILCDRLIVHAHKLRSGVVSVQPGSEASELYFENDSGEDSRAILSGFGERVSVCVEVYWDEGAYSPVQWKRHPPVGLSLMCRRTSANAGPPLSRIWPYSSKKAWRHLSASATFLRTEH